MKAKVPRAHKKRNMAVCSKSILVPDIFRKHTNPIVADISLTKSYSSSADSRGSKILPLEIYSTSRASL